MTRTIRTGSLELTLTTVERSGAEAVGTAGVLRRILRDPVAMHQVRAFFATQGTSRSWFRRTDEDVIGELTRLHAARRIAIGVKWLRAEPIAVLPVEATEQPPAPVATETHVFELIVIDHSTGAPVSGVVLSLRLPDGSRRDVTTGADGAARAGGLPAGVVDVSSDFEGCDRKTTYAFVGTGEPTNATAERGWVPKKADARATRIAVIHRHRVRTGDSLARLAEANGLSWNALAKFNWGTDDPDAVNQYLRTHVGCSKKTPDGKNYVFDSSDHPGIVLTPRPWIVRQLAVDDVHVVRVRRERRVFILCDEKRARRLPYHEYLVYDGDIMWPPPRAGPTPRSTSMSCP